jgi:EmrB/QacA subfamily drug resistance transporter
LVLAIVCAAQGLVILDASLIDVSLPTIGRTLHIQQQHLSWVINAYVLAFAGTLLLGGRLADLIGRRRVFAGGMTAFAAASLAGGLIDAPGSLYAMRALQGLSSALAIPAALSILTTTFTGNARLRALGAWGAVAGSGGVFGIIAGGVLTSGPGWQWIFFVKPPIALAAAGAAMLVIPRDPPRQASGHFDLGGAITGTAATSLLVYAIVESPHRGWTSATTLAPFGAAVILLFAFMTIERRASGPLVPLGLLRSPATAGGNVAAIVTGASVMSMFIFISLYMQQVLGYSPVRAGFAFLPLGIAAIAGSIVAARALDPVGAPLVLAGGAIAAAMGLAWFSQISPHGEFVSDLLGPSAVAGLGLGSSFVAVTACAVGTVPSADYGVASGLVNAAMQFGSAIGVAGLATIATHRTNTVMADSTSRPDLHAALTQGFQSAFLVAAGIALAGIAVAATLRLAPEARRVMAPQEIPA